MDPIDIYNRGFDALKDISQPQGLVLFQSWLGEHSSKIRQVFQATIYRVWGNYKRTCDRSIQDSLESNKVMWQDKVRYYYYFEKQFHCFLPIISI